MADIKLNVAGDTRKLESDIQKAVGKAYSIDLKTKGSQPLGRITSQLSEFNKSLEASNARVLAFGASAGVIYGLESAFKSIIGTTIEVQKALTDINVILNVSSSEIAKFGSQLFDIARNTGQSFNEVAAAATEFSRQGLGVEETLKRTSEALILSRLSGLDAAKSVDALTASVNSFASQGVTTTEIINKFANVDAAFAVSSADLAEAISRVGSSAAQSGVNLNELIAIVTSAQQTTARGGAVIGNSFKTIFTRLQRGDVVDLLDSLGVSSVDATGQLKSTIQLLQDLANVYDNLGTLQQAEVAEKVGGVFQINILKAALADLGKDYSIYNQALNTANASTDQAIQRNEQLNQTYAAQLNALKENAAQLAATAGQRVIGPAFERVVGGANQLLGGVNESDGQGIGATLAKGILDGLGQVIAGPGLALIGGVLIKLFKDFTTYASGSVKEVLGLNNASKQQAEIQRSINSILAQNPQLLAAMQQGTTGINAVATQLLQNFKLQTAELQRQDALTAKIASQLYSKGVRVQGGVPTATKAEGYIPAFAKETKDIKRGVGGAKPTDKAIGPFNINGELAVINSGEKLVDNFGGSGETAILTRDMQKSMSMATGYIPNFAAIDPSKITLDKAIEGFKKGIYTRPQLSSAYGAKAVSDAIGEARPKKSKPTEPVSDIIDLGGTERLSLIYGRKTDSYKKITAEFKDDRGRFGDKNQKYRAKFNASGFNPKKAVKPEDEELIDGIGNFIVDFTNRYTSFFGSDVAKINSPKELTNLGSLPSIAGTVFETAVTKATNSVVAQASRKGGDAAIIDFVSPNAELRELFNNAPGDYEAKISETLAPDVIRKGLITGVFKKPRLKSVSEENIKTKSSGYIPNFANPSLIQEVTRRARLKNPNIIEKLKEGSGLKDDAYIKAASKLGVDVSGLEGFMPQMGFPLKGRDKVLNLSKALGFGFGRSFAIDALKLGDWNYVKTSFESAGYTKDDFDKLSKFAKTQKGETAFRWGFKSRAKGYIPNYASDALNESIDRELEQSGLPRNQIYVAQKDALVAPENPSGLGVFNKRDEGSKASENKAIKRRSSGYIPNFAEPVGIEDSVSNVGSTLAALGSELLLFSFTLNGSREQYKQSIKEISEANREQAANTVKSAKEMLRAAKDLGGGVRTQSGLILKAQQEIRKASAPTFGQKLTAGAGAFGTSLAFIGPIVAETIANAIPQTTKAGRVGAAATSGVGQIAGFAGTGAMIGSAIPGVGTAIGAGVGALAGSLLTLNSVINELSTDLPELSAAAKSAAENVSKIRDKNSSLLSAYEAYQNALTSGNQEVIGKTQKQFEQALSLSTQDQRDAIQSSKSLAEAQNRLAEILDKAAKEEADKTLRASLADKRLTQTSGGVSAIGTGGFGNPLSPARIVPTDASINKDAAKTIGDAISNSVKTSNLSPEQIRGMKLSEGLTGQSFKDAIGQLNLPEPIKEKLSVADPSITIKFLNENFESLAESATRAAAAVNAVAQNPLPVIISGINASFLQLRGTLEKNIESISSYIKFANDARNSQNQFNRELATQRNFSLKTSAAEIIAGPDSNAALKFSIDEQLAKIEDTRQGGIEQQVTDLRSSILDTLTSAFKENISAPKQGEKPSPLAPESIQGLADPKVALNASKTLLTNLEGVNQTMVTKLSDAINSIVSSQSETGYVSEDAIVNGLTPVISGLGISDVKEAIDQLKPLIQTTNQGIAKGNLTAEQSKMLVAKEATQKLTLQSLKQAGQAFGGPEGYLDPESGPKAFDAIKTSIDKITGIQGGIEYRYGNRESLEKRKETMPDLGRGFQALIGDLRTLSGGLYSPKATDVGVQKIAQGRQLDIENQLKQYKDLLKTPELKDKQNQDVAKILKDAISSIEGFGTKRIAQIQTSMATGTLSYKDLEGTLKETYGRSQSRIEKLSPTLAPYLKETGISVDPVVNELSVLNGIQSASYDALLGISKAITSAPTNVALAEDKGAQLPKTQVTAIDKLPDIGLVDFKSKLQGLFDKSFGEVDLARSYNENVKGNMPLPQGQQPRMELTPGGNLSTLEDFGRLINVLENITPLNPPAQAIQQTAPVDINMSSQQFSNLSAAVTDLSNKISNLTIPQQTAATQIQTQAGSQNQPANISTNVNLGGINITANANEDVVAKFDAEVSQIRSQLQAVVSQMKLKFPPKTQTTSNIA